MLLDQRQLEETVMKRLCIFAIFLLQIIHTECRSTVYHSDCKTSGVGINDDSGTIYSPNYGQVNGTYNVYPLSCSVKLQIDATSPVQLIFRDFNMSEGDYCKINDLARTTNMFQFSGSNIPTLPLMSKSVSVYFYSNGDDNASRGYILTWTTDYASLPTTTLPPLSGDVTYISINQTRYDYVRSPDFPNLYPAGCVKDWIITAPTNSQISLDFTYFYTEETRDHLKILDGYDLASEMLIGDYSGDLRKKLPSQVVSSTPRLHLRFLTDDTTRFNGFNIRCSVFDPTAVTTTATLQTAQVMVKTTAATKSSMDLVSTICLAVILPLILVGSVAAGVVYVAWYQPRKLKFARQEALKRYSAMKEEYENRPDRPGTARPGSARPGSARPGSARPASARPGSALYGAPSRATRTNLETVQEGPSGSMVPRPMSAAKGVPSAVQRPMTAAQRQAVIARLPADYDERTLFASAKHGTAPTTGGQLQFSQERSQDLSYAATAERFDDEGLSAEEPLSIASLVGTKRSSRIKAPPQILVNDGFVDDSNEEIIQSADGRANSGTNNALGQKSLQRVNLPPILEGAKKLPPLQPLAFSRRPGQELSPSLAVAFRATPQPTGSLNFASETAAAQNSVSHRQTQQQQVNLGPPAASPTPGRVAPPAAAGQSNSIGSEVTGLQVPFNTSAPQRPGSALASQRPGSASAPQRPGRAQRNTLPSATFCEDDDYDILDGV